MISRKSFCFFFQKEALAYFVTPGAAVPHYKGKAGDGWRAAWRTEIWLHPG
jgi:hypothetical protein